MTTSIKPVLSVETEKLRSLLKEAYEKLYLETGVKVGSFTCGVYAFFDYDGEPIYVGQTIEGLSSRIGRHLTNQRTDAVAMSVLDPFEVSAIEMYPLVQHNGVKKTEKQGDGRKANPMYALAKRDLNALELAVFNSCIARSHFKAILNEKDPAEVDIKIEIPVPVRVEIVDSEVREIRGHPDVRLARRAQTIARLAQVISERNVNVGLRRALLVQAKRLQFLADKQLAAWGGASAVLPKKPDAIEGEDEFE